MVKLRLTRIGKKHAPVYRVIAIQARTKRDGKALEYLGHYNPGAQPKVIKLNKERIQYWLGQGAQPTQTVFNLLVKEGIVPAPKERKVYSKKPGRKKSERESQDVADKTPKNEVEGTKETSDESKPEDGNSKDKVEAKQDEKENTEKT